LPTSVDDRRSIGGIERDEDNLALVNVEKLARVYLLSLDAYRFEPPKVSGRPMSYA